MERSKMRLLIRDMASKKEQSWEGNKRVVEMNDSNAHWLYRIKRIRHATHPRQQPTSPLSTIMTHHATIMPL